MKRVLVYFSILLMSVSVPCAKAQEPTDRDLVDGVAAEVNGEPITLQEVLESVRAALHANPQAQPSAAELQKLYAASLENAIRTQLVLQEYAKSDMKLPDWIIDKQVSETIDSNFDGDRSKLLAGLAQRQMTFEDWRKEIEDTTILMAMRQLNVDKNVVVGPAQVRDYYLAHEGDFTRSAGTHLMLILLKQKADETEEAFQKRVDSIRKRLDTDPFKEIARYFSDDASAARGGDWGWIQPDMLRKELADALGAMETGETSQPIATSSGTYILRKEGVREDGLQPLESVRDEIVALLRRQESERLFKEWTSKLRDKAQVRILRPAM